MTSTLRNAFGLLPDRGEPKTEPVSRWTVLYRPPSPALQDARRFRYNRKWPWLPRNTRAVGASTGRLVDCRSSRFFTSESRKERHYTRVLSRPEELEHYRWGSGYVTRQVRYKRGVLFSNRIPTSFECYAVAEVQTSRKTMGNWSRYERTVGTSNVAASQPSIIKACQKESVSLHVEGLSKPISIRDCELEIGGCSWSFCTSPDLIITLDNLGNEGKRCNYCMTLGNRLGR